MNDKFLDSNYTDLNAFKQEGSLKHSPKVIQEDPLTINDETHSSDYYQARIDINPLVAHCSALLMLNNRFHQSGISMDRITLHQMLSNEIKAFVSNAKQAGYHQDSIYLARFLLCCLLDETIYYTQWGQQNWQPYLMIATFQNNEQSNDRFFIILERLARAPEKHIELLELIYLCLSLGFEGKYRDLADGKKRLDDMADKLFRIIQHQRGELNSISITKLTNKDKRHATVNPRWHWIGASVFTGLILITSIIYCHRETTAATQKNYQTLTNINKMIGNQ